MLGCKNLKIKQKNNNIMIMLLTKYIQQTCILLKLKMEKGYIILEVVSSITY